MINLTEQEFIKSFYEHNKNGAGFSRKYVIEAYKVWSNQKSIFMFRLQHEMRKKNLAWQKKQKTAFGK